ncbi:MAG: OmpA family protein [Treponema sp.]|nr:OmpA family protein [Treponema sp.]
MKKTATYFAPLLFAGLFVFFISACACPPPPRENANALTFSAVYFNPDEEDLRIILPALDINPSSWQLEVREPEPPYLIFHQWVGTGNPPAELVWDGRNTQGEWVHSVSDYPVIYSAYDNRGNTRTYEATLTVDAFVIREPQGMRILVPSIVFAPNSASFEGLDAQTLANNEWILSRIALTLEAHGEYQVRVEGHANPTINPRNTAGRQYEESQELQPLSEGRARTIVNELINLGIDRGRLSFFGMGGLHPVAAWEDTDNWWKNRRVEFLLR